MNNLMIKTKNKKHSTVGTAPKNPIGKIVGRGQIYINIHSTYIHDSTLSWHGTYTSIKTGRLKIVLWFHC